MIDLKIIRENIEIVEENLRKRKSNISTQNLKDLEQKRLLLLKEVESDRAKKNESSRKVGDLMKNGKKEEAESIKEEMKIFTEELDKKEKYDGIWACASILHLSKNDLKITFRNMSRALKLNGVIYTSFKYGSFEGYRNERYFTDFVEELFREFIKEFPELDIEDLWITADVRKGRGEEKWLNTILRKQ